MSDVSTFGSVKQLLVGKPIPSHSEQQALARVLAAGFATDRLQALASAAVNAAALPTLVLWIDAWIRLPTPVTWLALVTWPACAAMAMACVALASRYRRRFEAALPASRRLARLSFAPARLPPASAMLAATAGAFGSVLWLHAAVPSLVAEEPLTITRAAWAVLIAATVGTRCRELRHKENIKSAGTSLYTG